MLLLMLYIIANPKGWIVLWVISTLIYFVLLPKVGLSRKLAIIPFVAEHRLSGIYFKNRRLFYHALIISGILLAAGFYLRYYGRGEMAALFGIGFFLLAVPIYRAFLGILYWKIATSFHKNIFYRIFTVLMPFIFLPLLGRKSQTFYNGPSYYFSRFIKRWFRYGYYFVTEAVFAGIAVALLLSVGELAFSLYMPRPMVSMMLVDKENQAADIHGDGTVIDRQMSMGDEYLKLDSDYAPEREKYFPDHSNDKSVIVFEYIVGSNLEDQGGLASFNIDQMIRATKGGSALKFVIEAGGSKRWFTEGIEDETLARYEIADGKLTKIEDLDGSLSMSSPDQLYDFLAWAKKNYSADRNMLIFWDHGGGLSSGFGQDDINKRKDNRVGTMDNNEIIEALEKAGMKFDLIGFDACLMQSVEIVKAMEPYADYFLASEENENGDGWFYTSAFELLAKDPTVDTETFGKEMISSYDIYNTTMHNGKVQTQTTLSLIDLTRINKAFDLLMDFCDRQDEAIKASGEDYLDIASAASLAYKFGSTEEQIDLIHYLQLLDDSDYDDSIATGQEIENIVNHFHSTVVYRNAVANYGIFGLSMAFPYGDISSYTYEHNQFKALEMDKARNFYDDFFSIMAYQKKQKEGTTVEVFGVPLDIGKDYTQEEWYVEGFENYINVPAIIDIPLKQTQDGYVPQLPEDAWRIIVDAKEFFYQKSDKGWRYLGQDYVGTVNEDNRPVLTSDGYWVFINNQLVSYEADDAIDTPEGLVYKGTVRAMLKDKEIILNIEWDPIKEENDGEVKGRVTGYVFADNDTAYMEKGTQELKPGETIRFLFDYYNEQGELVKSETYGNPVLVTSMSTLRVSDRYLGECDLKYGLVMTDAYQRKFTTELLESHIPSAQ